MITILYSIVFIAVVLITIAPLLILAEVQKIRRQSEEANATIKQVLEFQQRAEKRDLKRVLDQPPR